MFSSSLKKLEDPGGKYWDWPHPARFEPRQKRASIHLFESDEDSSE